MSNMHKNNLFTLGYFSKRLRDAGITCRTLVNRFSSTDRRYWMISIFPDTNNFFCICYRDKSDGDYWFEFSDGKNKLMMPIIYKCASMNVIIDWLKKFPQETPSNASTATTNKIS